MRHLKWLTPFIFLIAFLLLLSACGGSLQKPTGLEEDKEEQAENMKAAEANDKKRAQERTEEKASNEDKQSKDKNKETAKKTEDKKSDAQTSTSDKVVTDKKDTTNKTDQSSSEKKDDSVGKKENKKEKTTANQDTKDKQSSSKTNKDSKEKKSNSEPKNEKKQTEEKKTKPEPQKEKEESPPKKETPKDPKNTVVFSISVPSEKVILSPTTIEVKDGDNVLNVLDQTTKEKGIQRSIQSSGYVSSIGNISERDRGAESGWMYSVNGTFPSIGAAGYTLKDGDVVEWLYTLDLGKDLGAH